MPITIKIDSDVAAAVKGFQDVRQSAETHLGATQRRMDDLERSTGTMSSRSQRHMQRVQESTSRMERAATLHVNNMQRVMSTATVAMAGLAAGAVAAAAVMATRFARGVLDAGLAADRMERSLVSSTGSIQAARGAMQFIVDTSNQLGVSIDTLSPAFARLNASTLGTGVAGEKTRDLFVAFSGAAQTLGLSSDQAGRSLDALTRIAAQNQIQMDELRSEFGSQFPGALQAAARAMGITTGQMIRDIEKQKISVATLFDALTVGLTEMRNRSSEMGESSEAAFVRMKNALVLLQAEIARSGLLDFLAQGANLARQMIDSVTRALNLRTPSGQERITAAEAELQQLQRQRQETLQRLQGQQAFEVGSASTIEAANATIAHFDQQIATKETELQGLRQLHQQQLEFDQRRANEANSAAAEQRRIDDDARARAAAEKAAKEGAAEAKRRAAEEERIIRESIATQQSLIAASFDEQRRMADEALAERLQREQQNVAQIAEERAAIMGALARDEAQQKLAVEERLSKDLEKVHAERAAMAQKFSQESLDQQIKDAEELVKLTESVNEQIAKRDAETMERRTREVTQQVEEQQRVYDSFADRVTERTGDLISQLLQGTLDVLDFFKQTFFDTLGQIIAQAAVRPIVVPIVASLVGGLAGAVSPVLGEGILKAVGLEGAGGLTSMFGPTSLIGQAVSGLSSVFSTVGDMILGAGQALSSGINNLVFGVNAPSITTVSEALGVFGGIAGIGGGIYNALTAQGAGGVTGGILGSIGGGVGAAATLGLLPAALGPVGLAMAALLPLLGNLIDSLTGAPKGPRLAIGNLQGLEITATGGQLQVEGALTSEILRAERIGGEQKIQAELEAKTQQAVEGIISTINAIAIDPNALLGPTQQALDDAFATVMTVNSSSRKNFEKDIAAQLAFIPVRFAAEFLKPLAMAFQQVADLNLDQEILALPQAAKAMVVTLQGMEAAVNELRKTENADVQGRIHELDTLISAFRSDLIDTTMGSIVDAFSAGVEEFGKALALTLALPPELANLHQPLGDVMRVAQSFAGAVMPLVADIERLELALTPLNEQLTDLHDRFNDLRGQIIEAGDNLSLTIPLYGQLREAILAEANLRIQQVQAIGATLQSIEQTLFQQLTPAEQQQSLLSDIAKLESELAGQTGLEAAETAAELAALNQQLLALGGSTDNLALQMEAIENLEALQPLLEQQLIALGGTTDVQEAIKNIQQQTLDTLTSMQEDLYNLFLSNTQVANALNLPVPVEVVNGMAAGGIAGFARGGVVPAMLEPGEAVFPPMNLAQQHALMSMNAAFPRFGGGGIVPGSGSGDIFPASLPVGGGVLNRRATRALQGEQGYQSGGVVSGRASTPFAPVVNVTVNYTGKGTDQDARDLARRIAKDVRDELRKLDQRTFGQI